MDAIILIGRILFVLLFFASGLGHLTQTAGMAMYAESMGVKPGRPLVLLTGLQIVAGGIMVVLGIWADLGMLLLAAFVLPTAFLMHPFWKMEGEMAQAQQSQFMKNVALGGAALMLFAFFAAWGDEVGLMITGPLFSL